ncbi:Uncharacterized protein (Fragment) OS=uncultured bacterium PE=4 SV=1 [Gemmataceae bacterium]
MTTINRVRVEEIDGPCLRCFVDHVYGFHWRTSLVPSRTQALHLLWESLWATAPDRVITYQEAVEARRTARLWEAIEGERMDGHNCTDEEWNRANAGRFISCIGVVDRLNCEAFWLDLQDERWDDPELVATNQPPRATFFISVTDSKLIAHLVPGSEWDSTSYDHDEPVPFEPVWRTSTVMALAAGIYEERAFERLPILADALQDAGCDADAILDHFREPTAAHVRGCWALDLVLGKE